MGTFSENLAFGQDGEHLVASALSKKGISVTPLYQFGEQERAPFMLMNGIEYVCPDLMCFSKGKAFFGEVKSKNKWAYNGSVLESGIDIRQYDKYMKIEETTGVPIVLFFNHTTCNEHRGIYAIRLSYTNVRVWEGATKLVLYPKYAMRVLE